MPETAELTDLETKSLGEIPHPSLPQGSSIYGGTKVFPDYQAEDGETYVSRGALLLLNALDLAG